MKSVFDMIDEDKSGEIDIDEFGKAIYECLKPAEEKVE
jgi:Ca2+-binding EF-hand superfamily protein